MVQGQSWFLVALAGSLQGHELAITDRPATIGREDNNDLVLLDDNVSRRHLQIHVQDDRVILTDLGSRNGTFINNQRITGTIVLNHGDRLALGSHLLEVQGRSQRRSSSRAEAPEPEPAPDDDKTVVHPLHGASDWMPSPGSSAPELDIEHTHKPEPPPPPSRAKAPPPPPPIVRTPPPAPARPAAVAKAPRMVEAPVRESTLKVPEVGAHPGELDLVNSESTIIQPWPEAEPVPPPPRPTNGFTHTPRHLSDEALRRRGTPAPPTRQMEVPPVPPSVDLAAPELALNMMMTDDPEPPVAAPRETVEEVRDRNRTMLLGGAAMVMMAMMGVIIVLASQSGRGSPEPSDHRAVVGDSGSTGDVSADAESDSLSALLSGEGSTSLVVGPQAYVLDSDEQALSVEVRKQLAQETFDNAVSLAESEKHKEALREFNHALALDGTCDICMIRANKVAQEIRQRIERYNSEGLRYFQSMKYEKAERSWERALLLLDDPQSPVGQKIQTKMLEARQQQARQSYR